MGIERQTTWVRLEAAIIIIIIIIKCRLERAKTWFI